MLDQEQGHRLQCKTSQLPSPGTAHCVTAQVTVTVSTCIIKNKFVKCGQAFYFHSLHPNYGMTKGLEVILSNALRKAESALRSDQVAQEFNHLYLENLQG